MVDLYDNDDINENGNVNLKYINDDEMLLTKATTFKCHSN